MFNSCLFFYLFCLCRYIYSYLNFTQVTLVCNKLMYTCSISLSSWNLYETNNINLFFVQSASFHLSLSLVINWSDEQRPCRQWPTIQQRGKRKCTSKVKITSILCFLTKESSSLPSWINICLQRNQFALILYWNSLKSKWVIPCFPAHKLKKQTGSELKLNTLVLWWLSKDYKLS